MASKPGQYCKRCRSDLLNGGNENACRAGCFHAGTTRDEWPGYEPFESILPIRVCSPHKDPAVAFGYLHEIYTCKMLKAFFKAFGDTEYAVLSRKNGICLSKRQTENYGNKEMINGDLLDLLKTQAPYYHGTLFIYWNHRPLTHDLYVKKMRDAGFNVTERATLAGIKEIIG